MIEIFNERRLIYQFQGQIHLGIRRGLPAAKSKIDKGDGACSIHHHVVFPHIIVVEIQVSQGMDYGAELLLVVLGAVTVPQQSAMVAHPDALAIRLNQAGKMALAIEHLHDLELSFAVF